MSEASTSATVQPINPGSPDSHHSDDLPAPTVHLGRAANGSSRKAKFRTEEFEFKGSKESYPLWKDKILLYMIANPELFPDDTTKVGWTMSFMTGNSHIDMWTGNRRKEFLRNGFPTWTAFQEMLEKAYGDPASEAHATEFLLRKFRQGEKTNRQFLEELEMWMELAGMSGFAAAEVQLQTLKRCMNQDLRRSLNIAGFPKTYKAAKDKLFQMEDEDRALDPDAWNNSKDSAINTAMKATAGSSTHYKQRAWVEKKKETDKPAGRPTKGGPRPERPPRECYKCQGTNRNAWHWGDKCPVKDQPHLWNPNRSGFQPRAPQRANAGQTNQAPTNNRQGDRRLQYGPGNQQTSNDRGKQKFTPNQARARAILNSMTDSERRDFLIRSAKEETK